MAMDHVSTFARKKSPFLWMSYPDPKTGRRVTRSTKLRIGDPASAKKAYELALERSKAARMLKPITDRSAWHLWAPAALKERYGVASQKKTLERLERCYRVLEMYFADRGIVGPTQITATTPTDYVNWRETTHPRRSGKFAKRNTALTELKCLSVLLMKAKLLGFIDVNHVHRHGIRKGDVDEKPEISDKEAAEIRAALGKRGVQWMTDSFEIGMHQGCRISETAMPLSWIDTDRRVITFRIKGGKQRATALHPGLVPLVNRRRQEGASKLVDLPRMASKEWWAFFKEIGKPHLCFHCTRVTVITKMARKGVPISQAMAYVLHASPLVHRIYQRLNASDLGVAVAAIDSPS